MERAVHDWYAPLPHVSTSPRSAGAPSPVSRMSVIPDDADDPCERERAGAQQGEQSQQGPAVEQRQAHPQDREVQSLRYTVASL